MVKRKHLDVNYPQSGEDTSGEYDEEGEKEIAQMLKNAQRSPMKKKAVRI